MSSEDVTTLIDMGFPKMKVERALEVTGYQGVEPAMEWLLAHIDEPIPQVQTGEPMEIVFPAPNSTPTAPDIDSKEVNEATETENGECSSQTDQTLVAKSLKCLECGKLFKSEGEMEFHAAKTGHSSFSESTEEKKPLTEEERREQLRLIEEKMRQKRAEREEKEKKEALERERFRIKSGKEMVAAKKKLEEVEMKKLVDQRKREKLEEKMARQRVKDQIEQDKIARRAKFGMVPAPAETVSALPLPTPSPAPALQAVQKTYSQTRLQIRLTNGQSLTQTFGSKEQLSAVRLYVEMHRTDGEGLFSLMTTFPKKVFDEEDYEKPLDTLGLVPSAVVIVTRSQ